jgi:hypothetical protein
MSYAERLKPGFARASSSWRSAALSPPGASSPPAFHGSDTLRFRWRPSGAVRAAMSHPGACTSPYHAHLAGRGGHGEITRTGARPESLSQDTAEPTSTIEKISDPEEEFIEIDPAEVDPAELAQEVAMDHGYFDGPIPADITAPPGLSAKAC